MVNDSKKEHARDRLIEQRRSSNFLPDKSEGRQKTEVVIQDVEGHGAQSGAI